MVWQIIIFLLLLPAFVFSALKILGGIDMASPFSMIVAIVFIAVFGGILKELIRQRKDFSSNAQRDIVEIKERITKIESDIADIKEQIADFIIKTN